MSGYAIGAAKHYRVIRVLGRGGSGEVYLVEHAALGRKEALKVLDPDVAARPRVLSRFRREARAASRLRHPNIVAVHDFGLLPDGRLYLATEYADGVLLRRVLAQAGPLPIARALRIVAQLASAVDHAHGRGVIHRDLKPENMMLVAENGQADVLKVLDFGIAKIIASDYQDSVESLQTGQIRGTPAYMAPEQIRGDGGDPRIDIYAIGCIAFELVGGAPPFTGTDALAILHAQLVEPPPRLGGPWHPGDIPAEYEAVVLRCLAKDPAERFQTGRELCDALAAVPEHGDAGYTGPCVPEERSSARDALPMDNERTLLLDWP